MRILILSRILRVSLQIECLWEECSTDADIHEALTNMPKDLDETYARCFKRTSNERNHIVLKILRWVYSVIRPFTVSQLKQALAIDTQSGHLDHSQMPTTQDILRSCANLIMKDNDDFIIFAHHTVRQFLKARSDDRQIFPAGFDLVNAKLELGQLCVAHLCSSDYSLSIQYYDADEGPPLKLEPAAILRLTGIIPH